MKRKIWLILGIIVLLGGLLRFWQLANHPVSLSIDEVAIAYNSYSILKTARDEHGQFLPLAFRSIGDFKPPVLVYLMTPAIAIFGLNEFGTRFTVALVGAITAIFVYFLIKELTKNDIIALITSFSVAISPWHIQFSRATFEAILALFFMIVGAWLFLRSMRLKGKLLWLSAIFFSLAMYSYHAERVVVPFLVLGLMIIFRQKLRQYKDQALRALVIVLIVSLPLLVLMLGPEGRTRAINAFIIRDYEIAGELKWSEDFTGLPATLFNNKFLILLNFWLKRYLDYWNLSFLFFEGVKLTLPNFPDVGLFHLFEIVPFLIGIWLVFFQKKVLKNENKKFLVYWLLIGPLAASVANNPVHPLRSLTTIPAPQILVGIGGYWLFDWLRRSSLFKQTIASLVVLGVVVVSLVYWWDVYSLHFPIHYSEFWSYGMEDLAQYAWEHKDEYQEIVVDPRFGSEGPNTVGIPYAYFLFYGQYEPEKFQNSPRRRVKTEDSVDFENFTFREIYWPKDRKTKNTLFIGSPWALPPEDLKSEQILKEIRFKNGMTGFLIVRS